MNALERELENVRAGMIADKEATESAKRQLADEIRKMSREDMVSMGSISQTVRKLPFRVRLSRFFHRIMNVIFSGR